MSEKNQLQEINPQPVVVNDATSMLQAVGMLAMDPNTDVEKIERLMAIQERLQEKENEAQFNRIMADVQHEIKTIVKNRRNEQTKSNYADLSAVLENTRTEYSRSGMALSFNTEPSEDPSIVRVVCYVTASGHTRVYKYDSPLTDKGIAGKAVMTTAHARGSAISYGRRYLTQMIFNLDTADDDDANASAIEWITPDQVATMADLIKELNVNEQFFLRRIGAKSLERIQAVDYNRCIKLLETKRK